MNKIAMLVWNGFCNDARVLKEAETLESAGYDVTAFALHEPGKTKRREVLASGVVVVRVTQYLGLRRLQWWKRSGSASKRTKRTPLSKVGKESGQLSSRPSSRTRLGGLLGLLATRPVAHIAWLARIIATRPNVIHAHDVNTLPTAWLAAVLVSAKLVYDAHEISVDREGYHRVRRLVGWVEKNLMPRAHGAITTTDARAKFFARAYKVPRPLVLQNRPRFEPTAPSNRLREEFKLRADRPIVLYQGGLQPGRGLVQLALVAAGLRDAYIVFIGGGRTEPELRWEVSRAGIEDRVLFLPTVALDQLPSYTRSADIGVQPIENTCLNHHTTDSNKLFEYVMAGLPVVASSMPEIRKVLETHECGLLVPPGDEEALAEALARLIDDGSLRQRLAAGARRAAQSLNWEAQEHLLVDLYAQLVGNPTKGVVENAPLVSHRTDREAAASRWTGAERPN